MNYFIFLILIAIIIFLYLYYEKKLITIKKRLVMTSSQFNTIRSEYRNVVSKNNNLNIKFVVPKIKTAITNNRANVFIAPISNSPKVKSLSVKMEVNILDSAIIDNNEWFYVSLPIDSDFNCRGWINKDDFSLIYSQSQNLTNIPH